jgi:NAD(P)-dependent dehydrogenase (short-subunit alcohol dehydrogenase family)
MRNFIIGREAVDKLKGKVAVVTGASKGIGASIAKHLVAEGAAVVVNYAASKEGAERVVSEIANSDSKAIAVQANVAKKVEIERLFTETELRPRKRSAGSIFWSTMLPSSSFVRLRISRKSASTSNSM